MKRKMTMIVSLLLTLVCAFALVGCSPNAEKTLKGVEDATATKVVVEKRVQQGVVQREEYILDGEKLHYTKEQFIIYASNNKVRIEKYESYLFWKEGDTIKRALKEDKDDIGKIENDEIYNSRYEELKQSDKYVLVEDPKDGEKKETAKGGYERHLNVMKISSADLGETLDGKVEYYGDKGKLLSEKQEDGTLKIQYQTKQVNGVYYPDTTWGVKDKKLVYKVRHLVTDNMEYYYSYDAQTVTIPADLLA